MSCCCIAVPRLSPALCLHPIMPSNGGCFIVLLQAWSLFRQRKLRATEAQSNWKPTESTSKDASESAFWSWTRIRLGVLVVLLQIIGGNLLWVTVTKCVQSESTLWLQLRTDLLFLHRPEYWEQILNQIWRLFQHCRVSFSCWYINKN